MRKFETSQIAFEHVISEMHTAEKVGVNDPTVNRLLQGTREELNYGFVLEQPLNRLCGVLRLDVAMARFVWMMTANNRLADIAFYEPKVRAFTDDGLTVPGSSYGMRLRQPQPGLDQVAGVIGRLKEDANTRRAALTIYQPWDAVRVSKDIPCAFGMLFHSRAGRLNTTIIMRSNNSWALLPFNMFEFSMLAEVIAVEAGLELGPITYFAGSMHIYERDIEKAENYLKDKRADIKSMPAMPRETSPLVELNELGKIEAELRHHSAAINNASVNEWITRLTSAVSPYWAQVGMLLLSNIAAQKDQQTLDQVVRRLDPLYRPLASKLIIGTKPAPVNAGAGPLFGSTEVAKVTVITRTALGQKFAILAGKYEAANGSIGAEKLLEAQNRVFERLAARGDDDSLTMEAFEAVLKSLS